MGEISPRLGACKLQGSYACLDQLAKLPEDKRALQCLIAAGDKLNPGEAGTRIAQIGIAKEHSRLPVSVLNGGERLKTAWLRALYKTPPPQPLILDEPANHLDPDSVASLKKS